MSTFGLLFFLLLISAMSAEAVYEFCEMGCNAAWVACVSAGIDFTISISAEKTFWINFRPPILD
jgi:hypothetical protein